MVKPQLPFFPSFRAIKNNPRLTANERLVAIMILSHRNNNTGECKAKGVDLEKETGLSLSTIRRTIKTLQAKGAINARRTKTGNDYAFPCQKRTP